MRLTAIKLAGFKSFVDPTTLRLPGNLTVVVGPNGSGKSNVIDAVRWVLGESNAKTLRGADADDVIFNGSKARRPSGRASVELLFDNSEQTLQGPYSSYGEIAVRRDVIRGESSQYFLNGQRCLKREVVDLFLGTGLGTRSQYAILEQGAIARLVEAKPEELRLWLEEAAGISRYKERRRETESRIRQTRENLQRLHDLEQEVKQRLEALHKQAAAASRYKELKGKERRNKVEILLLRRREIDEQNAHRQEAISRAERELEAARSARVVAEEHRVRCGDACRDATDALNRAQGQVYQAEADLSRQQQSLTHARELREFQARELRQIDSHIEETHAQRVHLCEQKQSILVMQRDAGDLVERARSREKALLESIQEAEVELQRAEKNWDDFNQRAQQPLLGAERERVRFQGLEQSIGQVKDRILRLQQERAQLEPATLQQALADSAVEIKALDEGAAKLQGSVQSIDAELSKVSEQRIAADMALHKLRHALEDVLGRYASLETLQQAALRQDDEAFHNWLKELGWSGQSQLLTVVRVAQGWEGAVEHVLGGLLEAPMLDSWLPTQLPRQGPPEGAVLVSAHLTASEPASGSLAEVVEGPVVIREWLQRIYRVTDSSEVARRVQLLEPGESLITPGGVWHGRGWVRYPRTAAEHSGAIARGQALRDLEKKKVAMQQCVSEGACKCQVLLERSQLLEEDRRRLVTNLEQVKARHSDLLSGRGAQEVRLEQILKQAESLDRNLESLKAQHDGQTAELSESGERLVELEQASKMLHAEHSELQRVLLQARERVQRVRSDLQMAVESRSQAQVHQATQDSAASAMQRTLEDLAHRLDRLQDQREETSAAVEKLDNPFLIEQEDSSKAIEDLERARTSLRLTRERLALAESAATEAQHVLQARDADRDAAMDQLQQERLAYESSRGRREALDAQLAETGEDVEAMGAILDSAMTVLELETALEQTRRRIERLGPINLAAISEVDEQQERAAYIGSQREDLEQALETLEDAMRKLDRETEQRFRDTYTRIDSLYRDRCPKLFGGGEGNLEMIGDDWLTGGVRVMARPPGKRNVSIQSLSGGEKALAALAMLFALFDLNPAPFCLLDEVEAPLDDANVHRFVSLLQEMSERVQFIIITHNKITMEMAEHLHGVTMQEPGVSRLVSVDMQQAVGFVGSSIETAEV